MFGYIKPVAADLKLREFELYKAYYCGLCKSYKSIEIFSRLSLSYDFVFLAVLREIFANDNINDNPKPEIKSFRCKLKPYKKRAYVKKNQNLEYTAAISSILNYYKSIDNLQDGKNIFKKLCFKIIAQVLKPAKNKAAKKFANLEKIIKENLECLNKLEINQSESVDECAENFAKIMSAALSFDEESSEIIEINLSKNYAIEKIGANLGRWIYIIDALDDFEQDLRLGEFNAFLNYYKTKENLIKDLDLIKDSLGANLYEIQEMFKLLDNNKNNYNGLNNIALNIINLGLPAAQERVINKLLNKELIKD